MFAELAGFQTILVTGLHRSGTTILATMIAHDTGHMLIREEDFRFSNVAHFEALIYRDDYPKVLQCPFMLERIQWYKDALVVFVHRARADIESSISRMKDPRGRRFGNHSWFAAQGRAYHTDGDIMATKLATWELQRKMLPHVREIAYAELAQHPLWVPPEARDWHHRATANVG